MGDVKPPKLPKKAPREIKDFIACKRASVELSPGNIDWLPIPVPLEATFKPGAQPGSVDIELKAPMMEPKTVPAKVADGKLELDPANLPFGADAAGEWVKNLNDWLASKGKKLGAPSVKDGKLTLVKEALAAAAPGGVKQGARLDPFPHVPAGEKAGAGALFALATVAAVALLPEDSTTRMQRPLTPAVSATTTTTAAPTTTTAAPTTTTAPPVAVLPTVFDACFSLVHFNGYSNIGFFFTTQPEYAGDWQMIFQGPRGDAIGTGAVGPDGRGAIEVQIFSYGRYANPRLMPVGGPDADLAAVGGLFPFDVGPDAVDCDAATLSGAPAASTEPEPEPEPQPETQPPTGAGGDAGAPPAAGGEVEVVEEQTDGGPPYSLLLIPGTLAFVGGGLWYDNDRRRERKWQQLREAVDAAHHGPEDPGGMMRMGQR